MKQAELAGCGAVRCARTHLRIAVTCWLAVLAVPCGAQPQAEAATATTAGLTAAQAWGIVRNTDRAFQQLVILGVINALNPRGSVTLPNGAVMPLGVSKQQCVDLKTELSEAVKAEAYGGAIERLIALGLMQREKADAALKGSAAWRNDAKVTYPRVAAACAELLVIDLPTFP